MFLTHFLICKQPKSKTMNIKNTINFIPNQYLLFKKIFIKMNRSIHIIDT